MSDFVIKAAKANASMATFSHPWNPNSEVSGVQLGKRLGLKRTGVNLVRVAAGKESLIYHAHQREEEWIYILSGRAIAEIDGREVEVGPGDFIAFPTPSVAHHLRNLFQEDLIYLVGGEHLDCEIADFPRHGKRMVRMGDKIEIYDASQAKPFAPLDGSR